AFFLFALSGCANKPVTPDTTTAETAQQATEAAAESEKAAKPISATEQLSSGKTTTIKTSQGNIEIQPTVVDMASRDDPETPQNEAAEQYNDPLEGWNRAIFGFNHVAYSYALIPLVKGY